MTTDIDHPNPEDRSMMGSITIHVVDPHGTDASEMIRQLSRDIASRYENDDGAGSFTPNDATVPRSVFLVACAQGRPVGCGALRPYDDATAEVKRMFVANTHRGRRVGAMILAELERFAARCGYARILLETGNRQPEAIRLYEREGYARVPNFGQYVGNPPSICFEKKICATPRVGSETVSEVGRSVPDRCRSEDFPGVLELLRQLWPGKVLNPESLRAVYDRALASKHQVYLCVKEGAAVVGFGSLTVKNNLWQEGNLGHIDELVVNEAHRGQGIGTRLLEALVAHAREKGCRRVELDSAFHRQKARQFYETHGFENRAFLFSKTL